MAKDDGLKFMNIDLDHELFDQLFETNFTEIVMSNSLSAGYIEETKGVHFCESLESKTHLITEEIVRQMEQIADNDYPVLTYLVSKIVVQLMLTWLYTQSKIEMLIELDDLEKGQ